MSSLKCRLPIVSLLIEVLIIPKKKKKSPFANSNFSKFFAAQMWLGTKFGLGCHLLFNSNMDLRRNGR